MILLYGLCYLVIAIGAGQNLEKDERVDGHTVGIRRVNFYVDIKDDDDADRRVRPSS